MPAPKPPQGQPWLCEWDSYEPVTDTMQQVCENVAEFVCEDSNGDHHYYCGGHSEGYPKIPLADELRLN